MKTYGFIGSDKNAGKTTALNFIYATAAGQEASPVCIISTGINGEPVDNFDGRPKPAIRIRKGSYFVTAPIHLSGQASCYTTIDEYHQQTGDKSYTIGVCKTDFEAVLEGPNTREALVALKAILEQHLSDNFNLLIDGSVDRQFLAHPSICDAFFFSILISDRELQRLKAAAILRPLSFPMCDSATERQIAGNDSALMKSCLMDKNGHALYTGNVPPFMDKALKAACLKQKNHKNCLYLNGALSGSLFRFLQDFPKMDLILDNFTLYQYIPTSVDPVPRFAPRISLRHPVVVKAIFIRQEGAFPDMRGIPFPSGIPVYDLFSINPSDIPTFI